MTPQATAQAHPGATASRNWAVVRNGMGGWTGAFLLVVVAVFVAYPLLRVVVDTFGSASGPTAGSAVGPDGDFLQTYREAFTSSIALSSVWGTVWLTLVTLLFGIPLSVLLAWITSSTDAPMARRLAMLPTLSLALSPLVGAIGWMVLLAPRVGILNLALRHVLGLEMDEGPLNAFSLPVIVMLMTFYIVPYIYGPAFAALSQVDASLQEAAKVCGAGGKWTLITITLPILRPSILAGALIGGVMCASMFAIPLILASGTGLNVIPTQIYYYINQEGRPGPAMAMASVLTVVTLTAMLLYFRVIGRGRFVTISGKGARRVLVPLGAWRWPAGILVLVFIFVSLIVPLGALVYISLVGFWSGNVFAQPLNFDQYRKLVDFPGAMQGLYNSTWLAAVGAGLALVLGFVISYRRLRDTRAVNRVVAFVASLPLGVPSIVLGLAVLASFTGGFLPLYGTAFILIAAYAMHMLPIAMRSSDAGLLQVSPELEEAGLVCGDSRTGVVARILLPALRRPLLTAWGLAFILLFRDISASILLYTPETIPSSVALLAIFDQGWMPGAAAYSIIVTVISAVVVALIIKSADVAEAG